MRRFILVCLFTTIGVLCLSTFPMPSTTGFSKTHPSKSIVPLRKSPQPLIAPTVVTLPPPVTTQPAPVPTTTVPVTVSSTTAPVVSPPTPVPTTSTTVPPASPSTELTSDVVEAWTKVAVCEEGGWGTYGFPNYPNSLGINSVNWYGNGGGSDLSISAQIAVGQRIATRYVYAGYVPDQNGCAAW